MVGRKNMGLLVKQFALLHNNPIHKCYVDKKKIIVFRFNIMSSCYPVFVISTFADRKVIRCFSCLLHHP